MGRRHVDKLFRVRRKSGERVWVYIHLEFQAQWIADLAERMFVYYSKLFLCYRRPILSLAVLGDDCPNWRPNRFESEIWGNRVSLEFLAIKLWDYRDRLEELKESDNPFAYFVLAHLWTLATQQDPEQRLLDKKAISLEMLGRGFSEREAGYLLKFIDAIMTLPEDLEETFLSRVHEYQEEKNMPIAAPIEKFYMEKLLEEGREEGIVSEAQTSIIDILNDRFENLPDSLAETIQGIKNLSVLRNLRRQAIKAISLEDIDRIIKAGQK